MDLGIVEGRSQSSLHRRTHIFRPQGKNQQLNLKQLNKHCWISIYEQCWRDNGDDAKTTPTSKVFSQSEVSFLAHSFFPLHFTPRCNVTYSRMPLCIQTHPLLCWSPKYTFSSFSALSSSASLRFFFNTTNTDHWADSANLEIQWSCYVMRF